MADLGAIARSMADADDLVVLARTDPTAFGRLYESYRLPVYRYLRSRSASDDDAADLTAATFERAFRAVDGYRSAGSPISWLLRIARNAAIDASRRRRPTLALDERPAATQPATGLTPEAAYLADERVAELRTLVQALPDPQRDAIALRYASGLTTREIATVAHAGDGRPLRHTAACRTSSTYSSRGARRVRGHGAPSPCDPLPRARGGAAWALAAPRTR